MYRQLTWGSSVANLALNSLLRSILGSILGIILIGCGQPSTSATAIAAVTPRPTTTAVVSTIPKTTTTAVAVPSGGVIWHPSLQSSWQLQLSDAALDPSIKVQIYDIDGFDRDAATVATLHAQGAKVICYINAGAWENWRPDAQTFPKAVLGTDNAGWPGEKWLDIRQLSVIEPLMTARMDMCKTKGFDAIDPDNIDGYTNKTGFALTYQEQSAYNMFLANAAHQRGLSIGLKNDLDQVPTLLPFFDWALDEQCFEYQECHSLTPFVQAGKAVFNVEYNLDVTAFCSQANAFNFNSLKKHLNLDAYRVACR